VGFYRKIAIRGLQKQPVSNATHLARHLALIGAIANRLYNLVGKHYIKVSIFELRHVTNIAD
jgi:hypothetical protein